jgi:uncharacterized ferritin-like protein (DUF455 family)
VSSLFTRAKACIETSNPSDKVALTRQTQQCWQAGELSYSPDQSIESMAPGYPSALRLVAPKELSRRSLTSPEGRAALIHAVAHIEYNAINLAWDAVYRFRGMPAAYYTDWCQVAVEEALHFELLSKRLADLGCCYGDFPAHNGLWHMAEETAYDVLVRMALVPRVLEARGLDVTPGMMARLQKAGDLPTLEILEIILRDEIGHVLRGTHWFRYLCDQRGLAPLPTFLALIERHVRGVVKGPYNLDARLLAGFTEAEMDALARLIPVLNQN